MDVNYGPAYPGYIPNQWAFKKGMGTYGKRLCDDLIECEKSIVRIWMIPTCKIWVISSSGEHILLYPFFFMMLNEKENDHDDLSECQN